MIDPARESQTVTAAAVTAEAAAVTITAAVTAAAEVTESVTAAAPVTVTAQTTLGWWEIWLLFTIGRMCS